MIPETSLSNATDDQIRAIIEFDGGCPTHLLAHVMEEAVRRETYNGLIDTIIKQLFKSHAYAEYITHQSIEDLRQLCYISAFRALEYFKPGKGGFLHFWVMFTKKRLLHVGRDAQALKRQSNNDTVSTEEEWFDMVDDTNVERKVVNQLYLDYLFTFVTDKQREILTLMQEGYEYQDVAEMTGVDVKAVRKRFADAKKKIRESVA